MTTIQNKKRETALVRKLGDSAQPGARWIPIAVFSQLAGITKRVARKIARRTTWRGAQLQVRKVPGRGGASGMLHEVLISSLPPALQVKWHKLQQPASLPAGVEEQLAELREKYSPAEPRPWTQEEREARHAAHSRLPTSVQLRGKRRFQAVILFDSLSAIGSPAAERYAVAAKEAGVSPDSVRRWVELCRGLDRGDWIVALAPRHRDRELTAQAPFDQEALEYIWTEYFRLTKPNLKAVCRRAVRFGKERGWAIPSYTTVKRRVNAEPHPFRVLMREGQEAFEKLYPTQQRDYSTLRLHEIWCCDGRRADVFCRWEDGTVSRPIVITWQEVRSRVILAYLVARTESADSIRLAFKDAAEKYRVIPAHALLDNSRAFGSKLLTGGAPNRFRFKVREEELPGILTQMGIGVIWTLPFAGRSKPIESFHRQYAEAEKRLAGAYCGNRPDARPEDFDEAKAVPIEQYRKLIEETLAEYHARAHRGDSMEGRSPREVYEALLPQCAPRQPSRDQLRLCLLAADSVKLDPDTGAVRLLGNRYWCEKLAQQPRDRAYVVRFNPQDLTEEVAIYDGERFVCEAPIIARTGFKDSQSARNEQRARRQFLKSQKRQVVARGDMSKARAWITPPDVSDALQAEVEKAVLPAPKVVTPLRPVRDYRPEKPEEPIISKDDFLQIILDHDQRRAGEG
ncbi:MAG: Mu transposase C-terminal domain-containing protein [Betaproteobacteria bacterium]|nr:Mu transposase C-terminal domain-containing protein [Betaproteobacteria bacterium]